LVTLAALVNVKDGRSCLFDLGFLEAVLESAESVSTVLDQRIAQFESRIALAEDPLLTTDTAPDQTGSQTRVDAVDKLEERLAKFRKYKALLNAFLNNRQAQIDLVSVNHPVHLPGTIGSIADAEGLFELGFECDFTGQYKSKSLFVLSVKCKRTGSEEIDEISSDPQGDQPPQQ
jgi:hypothetical protein